MANLQVAESRETQNAVWKAAARRSGQKRTASPSEAPPALLEYLDVGVVQTDADGCLRELNAAAELLLDLNRSQALHRPLFDLLPHASADLRESFRNLESDLSQVTTTVELRSGERRLSLRLAARRDSEGNFQGAAITILDETEVKYLEERRRSLEEELLQERKLSAIGIMAAGIAHNLNGPLAVIVGYLDMLYSRRDDLAEIPLILAQTERMKEIISNMMVKSRHEQENRRRSLDLNLLLQNELKFLEANLEFKHNVRKQYEFARDLPAIYGLYSDFSQVFLNLVNNAVDAMVDAPIKELRVRTRFDQSHLFVEIEDSGCGFDPDDREKLFQPFYTTKPPVGENAAGRPSGTGLGLSTVRQILGKMGGRIQAESRRGQGAKFTVIVPIAPNQPPQTDLPSVTIEEGEEAALQEA